MYVDIYQTKKVYSGSKNRTEYRPCLFSNGKGGFHVQSVAVRKGRQFTSEMK